MSIKYFGHIYSWTQLLLYDHNISPKDREAHDVGKRLGTNKIPV